MATVEGYSLWFLRFDIVGFIGNGAFLIHTWTFICWYWYYWSPEFIKSFIGIILLDQPLMFIIELFIGVDIGAGINWCKLDSSLIFITELLIGINIGTGINLCFLDQPLMFTIDLFIGIGIGVAINRCILDSSLTFIFEIYIGTGIGINWYLIFYIVLTGQLKLRMVHFLQHGDSRLVIWMGFIIRTKTRIAITQQQFKHNNSDSNCNHECCLVTITTSWPNDTWNMYFVRITTRYPLGMLYNFISLFVLFSFVLILFCFSFLLVKYY